MDKNSDKKLSHLDKQGKAHMVDVGDKPVSRRRAVATGEITMRADTLAKITNNEHQKGDVLACARLAGIMAAKKTSELIPLCHPLSVTAIDISFTLHDEPPCVRCTASAETHERTGVEMEALSAVHIALLTIYDMCKGVDRGMCMQNIHLLEKSGGRSGDWHYGT